MLGPPPNEQYMLQLTGRLSVDSASDGKATSLAGAMQDALLANADLQPKAVKKKDPKTRCGLCSWAGADRR